VLHLLIELVDLTLDQKLGQMFMARTPYQTAKFTGTPEKDMEEFEELLQQGLIGGFFAGRCVSPDQIKRWQEYCPVPMFVADDMENGAVGKGVAYLTSFPCQLAMVKFLLALEKQGADEITVTLECDKPAVDYEGEFQKLKSLGDKNDS